MSFGSCCVQKDGNFHMMESHKVKIEGFQKGLILNLEVSQTFINKTEELAEISYIFPNDLKICIYETTFVLGYQVIKPELFGREEARQIYQKALNSGETAVYGANIAEGLTELKIGNLPINEECTVILKMAFKANLIDLHRFNFKFPLDVYTPDGSLNCLDIKSNFSMEIQADKEMISLISSNVKNGQFNNNDKTYKISNEIQNNLKEKSIILQFKTKEKIQNSIMLPSKGNYCAVSLINDFQQPSTSKKEFIFLIDCSGSMDGNPIKNAGQCLEIFIRSLTKDVYFNIIQFGSRFKTLFKKSVKYDIDSSSKAIKLAQTLSADLGGTNLYDPLLKIFVDKALFNQRTIFILTDGEVQNRQEVIELVKNNSTQNKCFTIGLGRQCDAGLVEAIAEVSGGKCDFVQQDDSISEKVIPQLQASLCSCIDNIEIHCEGEDNDSFKIVPYPIPLLCLNNALQLFIEGQKNKKNNSFKNGILVTGKNNQETVEILINNVIQLVDVEEDDEGNSKGMNIGKAIYPLLSFELLKKYEQMDKISNEDKKMAITLSISSGVLCKYTGFFGMIEPSKESAIKMARRKGDFYSMNKSVYIDGVKCRVVRVSKAKTGKHGHAKTFIDLIDEKTGEKHQKILSPSDMINMINDDEKNESFDIMPLLEYQNFDGYWENKDCVNAIAGINVTHIDKLKLGDDKLEDSCIATLVAIATLRVLASDQINSWKIIEEKAMEWLKNNLGDVNIDDLLAEIEQQIQNRENNNE